MINRTISVSTYLGRINRWKGSIWEQSYRNITRKFRMVGVSPPPTWSLRTGRTGKT